MSWKDDYPYLHELFRASDVHHPDNYFARMDGFHPPQTVEAYRDWERRFERLNAQSRRNIIERAAPLVTLRDTANGRHWTALFETLNEVKGYNYLQDLGYGKVSFIPRTSQPTPDLHGSASSGDALLEVKTVNMSDKNISLFGTVQRGRRGLSEGLKNKLESDYAIACQQLHSFPIREPARRICSFYITIDLEFALVRTNLQELIDFFAAIETDCEIYHHSEHW
jgi:hypothetical protein